MSYKHKVGADMMAHIEFVNDETFPAVMVPGLRGVKLPSGLETDTVFTKPVCYCV